VERKSAQTADCNIKLDKRSTSCASSITPWRGSHTNRRGIQFSALMQNGEECPQPSNVGHPSLLAWSTVYIHVGVWTPHKLMTNLQCKSLCKCDYCWKFQQKRGIRETQKKKTHQQLTETILNSNVYQNIYSTSMGTEHWKNTSSVCQCLLYRTPQMEGGGGRYPLASFLKDALLNRNSNN
jgi:hypothetical protein